MPALIFPRGQPGTRAARPTSEGPSGTTRAESEGVFTPRSQSRGLSSLWSHYSGLSVASGCPIGQVDGGPFRPCRRFARPCCARPAQSWDRVRSPRLRGTALPAVSRLLAGADGRIQGQAVFGPGAGCFISRGGDCCWILRTVMSARLGGEQRLAMIRGGSIRAHASVFPGGDLSACFPGRPEPLGGFRV